MKHGKGDKSEGEAMIQFPYNAQGLLYGNAKWLMEKSGTKCLLVTRTSLHTRGSTKFRKRFQFCDSLEVFFFFKQADGHFFVLRINLLTNTLFKHRNIKTSLIIVD